MRFLGATITHACMQTHKELRYMSMHTSSGRASRKMCQRERARAGEPANARARKRERNIEMGWKEILALLLSSECQVIYIVILSHIFHRRVKRDSILSPKNMFSSYFHHRSVSTTVDSSSSAADAAAVVVIVVVVLLLLLSFSVYVCVFQKSLLSPPSLARSRSRSRHICGVFISIFNISPFFCSFSSFSRTRTRVFSVSLHSCAARLCCNQPRTSTSATTTTLRTSDDNSFRISSSASSFASSISFAFSALPAAACNLSGKEEDRARERENIQRV